MSTPTLGRYDRHVNHARLRMRAGAPRQTLAFHIEEALRLCSLPGEDEGRVYYFRHLHIAGLPENGDRSVWLQAFQHALLEVAGRAVHGHNPVARTADAVFFLNHQEACESLLETILQGQPPDAWFWPSVSGTARDASPSQQAAAVIGKLSRSDASWMAVAAAVLSARDPIALLNLLPAKVVLHWLPQMGSKAAPPLVVPITLPYQTRKTIERSAVLLGLDDARILWITALAVILASPSTLDDGVAVSRARQILQQLSAAILNNDSPIGPTDALAADTRPNRQPPLTRRERDGLRSSSEPQSLSEASPGPAPETQATVAQPAPPPESLLPNLSCIGERTAGAGLYFLLNALRHLKISETGFGLSFLAHFFLHVAQYAAIESGDPILLWSYVTLEQTGPHEINPRLLRIWLLKVRRWCWRNGRLRLTEIVRRHGVVTLTRTDLDVSLPLDAVDIRIRRIGLDLDPGWLPWFGRVVRFHYKYRGELYG